MLEKNSPFFTKCRTFLANSSVGSLKGIKPARGSEWNRACRRQLNVVFQTNHPLSGLPGWKEKRRNDDSFRRCL
jgi:hypothetical protein